MNKIVRNLTIQNYLDLKLSFENSRKIFWNEETEKLIHPGEYGSYREDLVKKWLRMYIPKRFEISSGFLINSAGSISTQCDVIIYDKYNTPQIENNNNQKFFPIETVAVVGEVKSDINCVADLNGYLVKLSQIKELRRSMKASIPYYPPNRKYNLDKNPYSNIFTFLICNKWNFDLKLESISYDDVNKKNRHNLILSLEDGVINYRPFQSGPNVAYSFMNDVESESNYIKSDNADLPIHITLFLSSICTALSQTTLLEVDMVHYLTDNHT